MSICVFHQFFWKLLAIISSNILSTSFSSPLKELPWCVCWYVWWYSQVFRGALLMFFWFGGCFGFFFIFFFFLFFQWGNRNCPVFMLIDSLFFLPISAVQQLFWLFFISVFVLFNSKISMEVLFVISVSLTCVLFYENSSLWFPLFFIHSFLFVFEHTLK